MEKSIDSFIIKPKELTYWRNLTKEDIKFGHGAIHYRDFHFEKCFDDDGIQKLKMKASDDKLIYYYCGQEYFTTSKAKLKKITV
jgi:hypothetical protein